ncbi:MAG: carboxylating nicotinate-nucleotide diphosphorylase [Bdellovibrionales bacterium]|nr:carboxylating nicotinate-nucleotide diphosphorylase [Bdellovibrionales bacterium]
MSLQTLGFSEQYARFFAEDDLQGNAFYLNKLPTTEVECLLKIKSDVLLSGLPYFVGAFNFLGANLNYNDFEKYEGMSLKKGEVITFKLPFAIALSGERVALNLLQQATRISTFTAKFVALSKDQKTKILDTRKTTPGLRQLEKYAVRVGGAHNHRFSQADAWMIKDNHKTFFGGLEKAWAYFQSMQTFYQNIIVEIHSLEELKLAFDLGVDHVMLDNFSLSDLKAAIAIKKAGVTYEVSGGVKLETLNDFLLDGIDAISIGALTHSAPHVDLSMKIKPVDQA